MARSWINNCVSNHNCGETLAFLRDDNPEGKWPSRLIDVTAFELVSQDVRLVNVLHLSACPQYAAISYRWGSDRNLHNGYITTTARLASRLERIEYSVLPKTLKDAIQICRNIGLRYIWIDAICIIQDSERDWQREAAKMPSIYGGSFLTIAADHSFSADGGCFNHHSHNQAFILKDHVNFYKLTSTLSNGQRSSLYLNDTQDLNIAVGPSLEQRAWTYQERILSPRIIHYALDQIFWECRQEYRAEDDIVTWKTGPHHQTVSGMASSLHFIDTNPYRNKLSVMYRWYFDIVGEHYSQRELSRNSDKLPALAGLARAVYPAIKSRYLAGIWLDCIHIGLAWQISVMRSEELGSSYFKRLNNGCPSWSWASCGLWVEWGPLSRSKVEESRDNVAPPCSLIIVEDVDVQLCGPDPFGGVRSVRLTVLGKSIILQVRHSDEFPVLVYLSHRNGTEVGQGNLDQWELFESITCLPIHSYNESRKSGGILLLQATGRAPDEYERKGFGWNCDIGFLEDLPTRKFVLV